MYPHRIRLRGPWECQPLNGPPPCRMIMPCRWAEGGLPGFSGHVRFLRRFGYPGQIDAVERVWITCAGLEGVAEVSLNGHLLGTHDGAFEHEVTALLRPRNELIFDVEGPQTGGLWGEVALEVRRTAYLCNVRFTREDDRWRAIAEVVGSADAPLELYLLVGRQTAAYRLLEETGGRVELVGEPLDDGPVRLELVQGAVVWYSIGQESSG